MKIHWIQGIVGFLAIIELVAGIALGQEKRFWYTVIFVVFFVVIENTLHIGRLYQKEGDTA